MTWITEYRIPMPPMARVVEMVRCGPEIEAATLEEAESRASNMPAVVGIRPTVVGQLVERIPWPECPWWGVR